jgi:hypothetical protein
MKNILKNWKTTLAGVILAGTSLATSMRYITPEVAQSILVVTASLGFVLAKDNNQTGIVK